MDIWGVRTEVGEIMSTKTRTLEHAWYVLSAPRKPVWMETLAEESNGI